MVEYVFHWFHVHLGFGSCFFGREQDTLDLYFSTTHNLLALIIFSIQFNREFNALLIVSHHIRHPVILSYHSKHSLSHLRPK